jgi:hypothetical protein
VPTISDVATFRFMWRSLPSQPTTARAQSIAKMDAE